MRWFPAAFLTCRVFIVTRVGLELASPSSGVHRVIHYNKAQIS